MKDKTKYLPNGMVHDTIILTSESSKILRSRFQFQRNNTFPFKFIVNENDVTQGTGRPNHFQKISSNITSDEVMLSTVMALKMQLLGQSTILNCCSSFHKVILSFLRRGCGAVQMNHFECLQDNENPLFRLCCHYSRTSNKISPKQRNLCQSNNITKRF